MKPEDIICNFRKASLAKEFERERESKGQFIQPNTIIIGFIPRIVWHI